MLWSAVASIRNASSSKEKRVATILVGFLPTKSFLPFLFMSAICVTLVLCIHKINF